jgi:hypothetical protein
MTITEPTNIGPLTHHEAMELRALEFAQTLDLLRSLDAAPSNAPQSRHVGYPEQ